MAGVCCYMVAKVFCMVAKVFLGSCYCVNGFLMTGVKRTKRPHVSLIPSRYDAPCSSLRQICGIFLACFLSARKTITLKKSDNQESSSCTLLPSCI